MTSHLLSSFRRASLTDVNSVLVSTACHLAAMLALTLLVAAGGPPSPGVQLAMDSSSGADTPESDDAWLNDAVQVDPVAAETVAMGPLHLFHDPQLATSDFGKLDAAAELAANESGGDGNLLAALGEGVSHVGPMGKAATEFFGIGGYGQTFVYVVDSSGSMRDGGKFQRAVYELLQSISQLNSDQRYFVFFYNSGTFPMAAAGPVAATKDQFERTREWVGFSRPDGGTYPLPALLAALEMKPDAIYFLSDGLFDPRTVHAVRARNRGRLKQIPIHTIAFVNRQSEALMRAIARNSGGKFRFVP